MSQSTTDFNPLDPAGMFQEMRNAGMDAWARTMVDLVNSEAYAESTGAMLDAWLTSSAPFRKMMESILTQTLAQLNLPSRDDVSRIAERLTRIEMRLDDLEAAIDDLNQRKAGPS